MCLIVSRKHHWFGIPRIALRDIEVYKCLTLINNRLCTPFMRSFINFTNSTAELIASLEKHHSSYSNSVKIYRGIHACRTFNKALIVCTEFKNPIIYNAIIPKGSIYYIGIDDDIVSNKLIMFKDNYTKAY